MKTKVLISVLLVFASLSAFADVLTLMNEMSFEGKVTKIKGCEVTFKVNHKKFTIPATEIFSIMFEDVNDEVYASYLQLNDVEKCMKGQTDADMYHGKVGAHIAWGVLFGPFAIIGAAVANPSPHTGANTYMMSQNRELFSDPAYLMCYKKKAKGKNAGNAAIGWGCWVLFVLLMAASSGY